ncbi:MAG: OmpA family protein [Panacagrimonas sp.]
MRAHRLVLLGLMAGCVATLLASCALIKPETETPLEFKRAIRIMGASLAAQLKQDRIIIGGLAIPDPTGKIKDKISNPSAPLQPKSARIAAAPIVDADSGESVAATAEIERLVYEEIRKASPDFSIDRMNPDKLAAADHILFSVIVFDTLQQGGQRAQKRYHVFCSIIERESKKVVASADAWIANDDLDYVRAELYEDSPVFPRDQRLQSLVKIAKSPLGSEADKEYYDSLETNALISEAESAFERKDYAQALVLFQKAVARPDGQVIKSYLGLYRSHIKLGDLAGAEDAFGRMLPIAAGQNNLSTKFLFTVNSTELVQDRDLRSQYGMWLRQISQYFAERGSCIRIVGHSSHTGAEEYNDRLSLMRAEKIRDLLSADLPLAEEKATAVGMGFSENIVGSGTDDARDMLDRRVEVAVSPCR